MPRLRLLPATVVLATVTALTLLVASVSIRTAGPAALIASTGTANRDAVERFYEAVNAVIATGDPLPLSSVLAPDYAEPDAAGTFAAGREALVRVLQSLHATAPGLQLAAESLVTEDDRVVVMVRTSGIDRAAFLGLELADPLLWGPIDVFRVAAGLIAERVSAGGRLPALEPLVQAPVELRPPGERTVTAVRVTVAPGGWRRIPAAGGLRLLIVEAGPLAVTGAATSGAAALPDIDAPALATGDWQIVLEGDAYTASNPGHEPAVYLEMLFAALAAPPGAASAITEGATTQVLAGGQTTTVPTGPAALAIGRAMLSPGARLAWTAATGPVLLVVEAGSLRLATEGSSTWVHRTTGGSEHSLGVATLAVGDGALVGPETGTEVRNQGDGPLEFLVVTLLGPSGEPPTTG